MFDSFKIQNVSNFYFEERATKKQIFEIFLKSRYFEMGGCIDMNIDAFW